MLECSWSFEIEEDLAAVLDAMDAYERSFPQRMLKDFGRRCATKMLITLPLLFMMFKTREIIESWWLVVGVSVLAGCCFTKILNTIKRKMSND